MCTLQRGWPVSLCGIHRPAVGGQQPGRCGNGSWSSSHLPTPHVQRTSGRHSSGVLWTHRYAQPTPSPSSTTSPVSMNFSNKLWYIPGTKCLLVVQAHLHLQDTVAETVCKSLNWEEKTPEYKRKGRFI